MEEIKNITPVNFLRELRDNRDANPIELGKKIDFKEVKTVHNHSYIELCMRSTDGSDIAEGILYLLDFFEKDRLVKIKC